MLIWNKVCSLDGFSSVQLTTGSLFHGLGGPLADVIWPPRSLLKMNTNCFYWLWNYVVLRTHFSEAIKAIRWGALGKSLQVESTISSSRIPSVWLINSIDFFKINRSFNWKFVKQFAKRCGELITKYGRIRRIENKSLRYSLLISKTYRCNSPWFIVDCSERMATLKMCLCAFSQLLVTLAWLFLLFNDKRVNIYI